MNVMPWRRMGFRIAGTIFAALLATQALNFVVFLMTAPHQPRPYGVRALAVLLAAEAPRAFAAALGPVRLANGDAARIMTLRRDQACAGARAIDAGTPYDLRVLAATLRARASDIVEIRLCHPGPYFLGWLASLGLPPDGPHGFGPPTGPSPGNGGPVAALDDSAPDIGYFGPLHLALRGPGDAWLIVGDARESDLFGRGALGPLISLAATLLAVIAVAQWFAGRETRPLRALAETAERIGRDGGHVRAPPGGSHEVAALGEAFNRMQDRVQAFLDERRLMLGALSHDLRTPLTRMRLAIHTMEDPTLRGELIGDIEEMRMMVEAALRFARDDAADEARRPTDLAVLAQSLCDDRGDRGERADYRGPDHCIVTLQPLAVKRALANVIDNAWKFAGGVEVELQDLGANVALAVADRGPGIKPEMREEAFAPFRRLEGEGETRPGAGLGLAIARDAILAQGGEIRLESNTPRGLIVAIRLPRTSEIDKS